QGEINFGTFKHEQPKSSADLVRQFDDNMKHAHEVLSAVSDEKLAGPFVLKRGDQVLIQSKIIDMLGSSINHSIHHRGQLTVYLRLNNIPVPSIYGPSADDKTF